MACARERFTRAPIARVLIAGAPVIALACALLAATHLARADPVSSLADGRAGRVEFRSATPNGPTQLVRRTYPPQGTVVAGDLVLPASAADRVPAMVIAHGSGGILPGREDAWARRLGALGIATFTIDSFGPRGLTTTAMDQGRLSTMANLTDALAALSLLATHPRIDSARIGVIGFSRGGQVALYSALEPLRRAVIDGDLRFAVHVALYPSCSIPYRARQVTGAPMLILLGAADDYTPPQPCRAYADWFRERGAPVRLSEYAEAASQLRHPRAAALPAGTPERPGLQRGGRRRDRDHAAAGHGRHAPRGGRRRLRARLQPARGDDGRQRRGARPGRARCGRVPGQGARPRALTDDRSPGAGRGQAIRAA